MDQNRNNFPKVSQHTGYRTLLLGLFLIGLSLVCVLQKSLAVMGSDWKMTTPAGHHIHGGDRCSQHGGVCLVDSESSAVQVSHIRRWRYYDDYVVGEREHGWFIFHESSRQTQHFSENAHWQETLNALQLGKPLSAWLTPKDGSWRDSGHWFVLICLGYIAGIGIALSGVFWLGWFALDNVVKSMKNRH